MCEINRSFDYVVIANLFSGPEYSVLIGYKGENTLDNLYIINEFECKKNELDTFKMLFSIFSSSQCPKEFVDFFVENERFYSVFKYVEAENIKQKFRKGFNFSPFDERCVILENILIRIDRIYNFPPSILGCLTELENIHIDEKKNIHLIYNFKNMEKYNNGKEAQALISQNIGKIIYTLLEPESEAKFNKPLHIVIDKCKRGVYRSIPEMVIELKKAEKISKTSSWFSYIKYQISLRKPLISKISKVSMISLVVAGVFYLAYSKLTEGQQSGTAATAVTIGEVTYNGNTEDESDKTVAENIDNQTGTSKTGDIILPTGLDIEFEDYVVQHGDTIASICTSYYKDNRYITAVASFNGIETNETLTAGSILKLPNRTAIALYLSK